MGGAAEQSEGGSDWRQSATELAVDGAVAVVDRALDRVIKDGGLSVVYPNGREATYGDNEHGLTLAIHTPAALGRIAVRPEMMLGVEYVQGGVDITMEGDDRLVPAVKALSELALRNAGNVPRVLTYFKRQWNRRFDFLRREPSDPAFHYDRGDALYRLMLDNTLTYSCAFLDEDPDNLTLEEAQVRKRQNILNKLEVGTDKPMRLLDIGSGWGHLLIEAAEQNPELTGAGVTLSVNQLEASRRLAEKRGVADRIEFKLMSYEDLARDPDYHEHFDAIVSVGMFEHAGRDHQDTYFEAVDAMLKDGGKTLVHTITKENGDPVGRYVRTYIFPGGDLPTDERLVGLAARHGFRDFDLETRRKHYEWTLDRWGENLEANKGRFDAKYGTDIVHPHKAIDTAEKAFRAEAFYLGISSAGFSTGHLGLSQLVATKGTHNGPPYTRDHMTAEASQPAD